MVSQNINTKYRYMQEADIEISRDIEINSNPVPWTEKNFLDCLRKEYYCLIQELDKEVSGFAIQTISLDESHLLNIGIREEFRNKGLGQDLLDQIVHASKSMGSKKIFLENGEYNIDHSSPVILLKDGKYISMISHRDDIKQSIKILKKYL